MRNDEWRIALGFIRSFGRRTEVVGGKLVNAEFPGTVALQRVERVGSLCMNQRAPGLYRSAASGSEIDIPSPTVTPAVVNPELKTVAAFEEVNLAVGKCQTGTRTGFSDLATLTNQRNVRTLYPALHSEVVGGEFARTTFHGEGTFVSRSRDCGTGPKSLA